MFMAYNSMIKSTENYKNAWSQVENQYQRRFDLVPNIENSVKIATKQEMDVFKMIAGARSQYSGVATNPDATQADKINAMQKVDSSFSRLLAIVESYPQLKSVDAVQSLMIQLEGTENRIATERQKYNDAIKSYNLIVKRIPGVIFAKIFGFEEQVYFESATGSNVAPKINND